MDFVTRLAMPSRGYDAVLTITDRVSTMVHLVPLQFKGSSANYFIEATTQHAAIAHMRQYSCTDGAEAQFASSPQRYECSPGDAASLL